MQYFEATIDSYLLEALHTLPVRTLKDLGFRARVGLSNDSQLDPSVTTDYLIRASVYSPEGKLEKNFDNLGVIAPGEKLFLDLDPLLNKAEKRDQLVLVRLIPKKHLDASPDKVHTAIPRKELYALVALGAHQVEYYREDGYSSVVLIATTAFNYKKFHNIVPTTLIQAPKVFLSNDISTYMSLMNYCPDPAYDLSHQLSCTLTNSAGEVVTSWKEQLAPFETKLVDLKEKIRSNSNMHFDESVQVYCASAYCDTATIFPMFFTYSARTKTIGFEHTFPPRGYADGAFGKIREQVNTRIKKSRLFQAVLGGPGV